MAKNLAHAPAGSAANEGGAGSSYYVVRRLTDGREKILGGPFYSLRELEKALDRALEAGDENLYPVVGVAGSSRR